MQRSSEKLISPLDFSCCFALIVVIIPGPDHHVRVSSWPDHILLWFDGSRTKPSWSHSLCCPGNDRRRAFFCFVVAGRGCKLPQWRKSGRGDQSFCVCLTLRLTFLLDVVAFLYMLLLLLLHFRLYQKGYWQTCVILCGWSCGCGCVCVWGGGDMRSCFVVVVFVVVFSFCLFVCRLQVISWNIVSNPVTLGQQSCMPPSLNSVMLNLT